MPPPGRLVTLRELEQANACPGGLWAFYQAFGEAAWLTEDCAEQAAPWLHWLADLLGKATVARLRRAELRWWVRAARQHGCDLLHLPATTVAELRLKLARAVLREIIALPSTR